jgi:1,4-dihydroxy-2-naphthoate octaprenyltransferase
MSQSLAQGRRSRASVILQLTRPFSFTASILPVLVGAAAAASSAGPVSWWLLPLALAGAVLFHAATNVISDCVDFRTGVDRDDTMGSSGVLVGGLMSPRQAITVGLCLLAAACVPSAVIALVRGWTVVWLGVLALAAALSYCGWPLRLKYVALGDAIVFVIMGPIMVWGSYFALTGTGGTGVLLVSLPVGCLVAAILDANNIRDIDYDRRARIHTMASVLGHSRAKIEYYALVAGAFIAVAVMVLQGVLKPWTLLVLLSLPLAVRNLRAMHQATPQTIERIAKLDVQTAQLHLLFGVLYAAGLLVSAAT